MIVQQPSLEYSGRETNVSLTAHVPGKKKGDMGTA